MSVSMADVLYDGESVVARVDCGANALVVTTNRVVALTPDGDGERVQHADRPNVETVRTETAGDTNHLSRLARAAVVAVFALAVAYSVSLDGLAGSVSGATDAANRVGYGPLVQLFAALGVFLRYFDDGMLVLGLLAAAVAVGSGIRYLRSRTRALVVETYGDDELRVPAPNADEADVGRVLEALD